jgi:hypothetical protein
LEQALTAFEPVALEAKLVAEDATSDITAAVTERRTNARKHFVRIRNRNPDATPEEVIQMLERHYAASISTAGAVIAAGSIAVYVGITLIPVAGAAAAGLRREPARSKEIRKRSSEDRVESCNQRSYKGGRPETTANFGLARAEFHGMELDQYQAHALVYGLSNGLRGIPSLRAWTCPFTG